MDDPGSVTRRRRCSEYIAVRDTLLFRNPERRALSRDLMDAFGAGKSGRHQFRQQRAACARIAEKNRRRQTKDTRRGKGRLVRIVVHRREDVRVLLASFARSSPVR